ncbi:MAG: hypothetical protein EOS00_00250 [Mesorhizobium sp.]|nr:MAG: hypothetical protein EOS00_00250 [Mesorhizobium sp.]
MSSFAPPSVLPDISPSRGEIALSSLPSPNIDAVKEELSAELPISLLEGEMSGRTEGGATERDVDDCHPDPPHELG